MTDPVKIIVGEGDITEVNVPEYNLIQTGGGGSAGATFFPEVSEEGVISWTNDGGYDNPEPVNIKGPAGNDGNDGEDGVSPTVTFTTITGGHTMTVTDKDHPSGQSINIMDGTSGGGGTSDYDDLTDKPSINDVTLSGNKTAAELGLGTYSKPSGGIPQTDLASAVQSKLDNTVVVSDTQPTATENKLWVDTDAGTGSSYQVPTVAEMDNELNGEEFSSKITFTVSFAHTFFIKIGRMCFFSYQSDNKAFNANDLLFTLPSGYRPITQLFTVATVNAAAYGDVVLNTDGTVKINHISSSVTGRVYTNGSYVCAE